MQKFTELSLFAAVKESAGSVCWLKISPVMNMCRCMGDFFIKKRLKTVIKSLWVNCGESLVWKKSLSINLLAGSPTSRTFIQYKTYRVLFKWNRAEFLCGDLPPVCLCHQLVFHSRLHQKNQPVSLVVYEPVTRLFFRLITMKNSIFEFWRQEEGKKFSKFQLSKQQIGEGQEMIITVRAVCLSSSKVQCVFRSSNEKDEKISAKKNHEPSPQQCFIEIRGSVFWWVNEWKKISQKTFFEKEKKINNRFVDETRQRKKKNIKPLPNRDSSKSRKQQQKIVKLTRQSRSSASRHLQERLICDWNFSNSCQKHDFIIIHSFEK